MGPPQRRWEEAYRTLSGSTEDLDASNWERLAVAGYMIGEDDTSGAAWEATHRCHLDAGPPSCWDRPALWPGSTSPPFDVAKATPGPTGAHIEWHVADAAALPLADAAYDVVLCQMGLMFIEDRLAALAEMRRVLTPGGRLVLNTPGRIQPAFEVMEEAIVEHISPELGGFVRVVFSIHDPDFLASLLRASGFEEVRATSEGRLRVDQPMVVASGRR